MTWNNNIENIHVVKMLNGTDILLLTRFIL